MRVKLINADNSDIKPDITGPVNLTLHLLFSQMSVELNEKPVSEPNHLYPYRAYLEKLINYSQETQNTRLLCEGLTKDTAEQMNVTDVTEANIGLCTRVGRFARSNVVKLIGRLNLDVFQQDRLIPPRVDVHLRLIPEAKNFVFKSVAAKQGGAAQQNYKAVI